MSIPSLECLAVSFFCLYVYPRLLLLSMHCHPHYLHRTSRPYPPPHARFHVHVVSYSLCLARTEYKYPPIRSLPACRIASWNGSVVTLINGALHTCRCNRYRYIYIVVRIVISIPDFLADGLNAIQNSRTTKMKV